MPLTKIREVGGRTVRRDIRHSKVDKTWGSREVEFCHVHDRAFDFVGTNNSLGILTAHSDRQRSQIDAGLGGAWRGVEEILCSSRELVNSCKHYVT